MDKPIIIIIAFFLLVGLGIAVFQKKRLNRPPDFRVFFILGIIWIPLGISTKNYVFSILGCIFTIIGIMNKDKWQKNIKWSQLDPKEKKIKLAIIILINLILITGIILYFLKRSAA